MAVIYISQLTCSLGYLETRTHIHLEALQKNGLRECQEPTELQVKIAGSPVQQEKSFMTGKQKEWFYNQVTGC